MQKTILILAVTSFLSGTALTGHEISLHNKSFLTTFKSPKPTLVSRRNETNEHFGKIESTNAGEWKALWQSTENRIENNQVLIKQLRDIYDSNEKTFDDRYLNRIDTLELTNQSLKAEMETYIPMNDLDAFHVYMNQQMDKLREDLNTLVLDYHY